MHNSLKTLSALTLLALTMSLQGCARQQHAPPVEPPAIPALPMEARQPPVPPYCQPTCLGHARRSISTWQQKLTGEE